MLFASQWLLHVKPQSNQGRRCLATVDSTSPWQSRSVRYLPTKTKHFSHRIGDRSPRDESQANP